MRGGILINARLTSTRLPGKHLIDIAGKPALAWLIERLPKEHLWIATGRKRENSDLEKLGVPVFYGNPMNIPQRHYQLAMHHKLEAVISIDGDDLLTSRQAVDDVLELLKKGAKLVKTTGLPMGMNVLWAYRTDYLRDVLEKNKSEEENDTSWGWIFDGLPLKWKSYQMPENNIRLSLDYREDLPIFSKIFSECPENIRNNDKELCQWIIANASIK